MRFHLGLEGQLGWGPDCIAEGGRGYWLGAEVRRSQSARDREEEAH